jgi:hypothetical protein
MVIILPESLDLNQFDKGWPAFLKLAEKMPGLIQESVTRIDQVLYGSEKIQRIYTFSFQDRQSMEQALTTGVGEEAGKILHQITNGEISILAGANLTDNLDRIHSFSATQEIDEDQIN